MDFLANTLNADPTLRFLMPGGEMRTRIREFDWSTTELGDPRTWSSSFKTAVAIMLDSAGPAYMGVGPRFVQLYNDAYIPIFGKLKHPQALGLTTSESWSEIWDAVAPLFDRVMSSGQAVSMENHLFPMRRNGYLEECYFTFTYSPLTNESGQVYGIFATGWETTAEFVTNRRANTLHALVQHLSNAENLIDIHAAIKKAVLECWQDLPFGLFYEVRQDRSGMDLMAAAGIQPGSSISPEFVDPKTDRFYAGLIDIDNPSVASHSFDEKLLASIRQHPFGAKPDHIFIVPLCYTNSHRANAYLVLAANPMRPLDAAQKGFFEEIRMRIESAVRRISAYDLERRERQHQFQTVMSVLPCLVWMSDTANQCVFVNRTWLELTGRTFDQEIGTGWMKGIHPDDIEIVKRCRHERTPDTTSTVEYRLLDAHGTYRWILDEITPRYGVNGEFLGYVGTCLDITERKIIEQEVLSSQSELRTLYDRLQRIREEERCALAREVHDQLGQILSAAKIDIKLLEEDISRSKGRLSRRKLSIELGSAGRSIDRSIQVVRRLATELRPPELKSQGLTAAIEWHARDFERRSRIRCHIELAPDLGELDESISTGLFGIFQEAMTNVLRHAKATEVRIKLDQKVKRIRLRVIDNGVGIAPAQVSSTHSMGLKGMRERAGIVGGRLIVGRLRQSGTLVSVIVPPTPDAGMRSQQLDFVSQLGETA